MCLKTPDAWLNNTRNSLGWKILFDKTSWKTGVSMNSSCHFPSLGHFTLLLAFLLHSCCCERHREKTNSKDQPWKRFQDQQPVKSLQHHSGVDCVSGSHHGLLKAQPHGLIGRHLCNGYRPPTNCSRSYDSKLRFLGISRISTPPRDKLRILDLRAKEGKKKKEEMNQIPTTE